MILSSAGDRMPGVERKLLLLAIVFRILLVLIKK